METIDKISGKIKEISSRFSMKSVIDINEQPLFRMPNYMFRLKYWLGAMVGAALIYEVISGLFLLLNYYPSDPYNQTIYMIYQIPFGAPILFSHLYGAYVMIFLIYIHMFRNYFDGAYKKPRQFQWVIGIILFALTLATAFTGYSLPADILGLDADDVARGILGSLPSGTTLSFIIFGNGLPISQYTRLLGFHVILTALIGAFFAIHFMLFEQNGVMPSEKVKGTVPAVYPKKIWEKFNPWWPRNFVYTLAVTMMVWGIILLIPNLLANVNGVPFLFQPAPAPPPSSPSAANVPAYPPWFFLFLYKALDFNTPTGASYNPAVASLLAALIPALFLLALPWLDRSEETAPHKRPLWIGIGILLITYVVQLSVWAYTAPGVREPFSTQVGIMLPPLIIAFVSIYGIPRLLMLDRRKLELTPKTAGLLIVVGLTLIGTIGAALSQPTVYALGIIIPIGLTFSLFAKRVLAERPDRSVVVRSDERRMNPNVAMAIMFILFVIAAGIVYFISSFPITGYGSTFWGMGTGVILLIFSYALILWDYVAYPQEEDEIPLSVLLQEAERKAGTIIAGKVPAARDTSFSVSADAAATDWSPSAQNLENPEN
jgi:quinol-cytochrome oxidoreductase complex cytochrome b subunit